MYHESDQQLFHTRKEKEIQDLLQKLIDELLIDCEEVSANEVYPDGVTVELKNS